MGACINVAEVKSPVGLKRTFSKKTSIENGMEMTNSMRKLRRYEEMK
jgi:hypothetical protein